MLHQPVVAAWALVPVSLAAKCAEELSALFSVRALSWLVQNLLTNAADKILIYVFQSGTTQAQNVETLLRVDLGCFLSSKSAEISLLRVTLVLQRQSLRIHDLSSSLAGD